jgi:hypothetical protein
MTHKLENPFNLVDIVFITRMSKMLERAKWLMMISVIIPALDEEYEIQKQYLLSQRQS